MQTFLPFADFQKTAEVLDYRRLGKQRVETWQLLRAINKETRGWQNHPAAVMWRGYTPALAKYGEIITREWIKRGYQDGMLERFIHILEFETRIDLPPWFGDMSIHLSHQSNLVRKFPEFYRPIWPDIPDDLLYVWPGEPDPPQH